MDSYPDALALYLLMNIELWSQRCSPTTGLPYNNGLMLENITKWRIRYKADQPNTLVSYSNTTFPHWWGDARVHDSDKGILYRKDHTAYAHFKRYALQYEQYVWPYQIEEEARKRQMQAAGLEAEERESEGDEEPEGFVPDELKEEKASEEAETKRGKKAKGSRAVGGAQTQSTKRRRLDSAAVKLQDAPVELDDDDEQVDAAVVSEIQRQHEANGRMEGIEAVRQQKGARHKRAAHRSERAESAAADVKVVQSEPRSRGRGRKTAVKRVKVEDGSGAVN